MASSHRPTWAPWVYFCVLSVERKLSYLVNLRSSTVRVACISTVHVLTLGTHGSSRTIDSVDRYHESFSKSAFRPRVDHGHSRTGERRINITVLINECTGTLAKRGTMVSFALSLLSTFGVSLFLLVHAAPAHLSEPTVKHSWQQIPTDWEVHSAPAGDHPITLKIGLKQSRIDELIDNLYQVSDPFHERYGQHLSRL